MADDPIKDPLLSRRRFVTHSAAGISAAWVSFHWPAMLRAAEHAHRAAKLTPFPALEFFTSEEAKEVDAIASRIIPSGELPGAREAGVVLFIDKALVTFAKDNQRLYRDGLVEIQARVQEMYPGVQLFSAASASQQDAVLESFDHNPPSGLPFAPPTASASDFFETIRAHTIAGFLIDPDADRGGNRDAIGWKVIGRDPAHFFQPPFGFYDKNYPGWQPAPKSANEK